MSREIKQQLADALLMMERAEVIDMDGKPDAVARTHPLLKKVWDHHHAKLKSCWISPYSYADRRST